MMFEHSWCSFSEKYGEVKWKLFLTVFLVRSFCGQSILRAVVHKADRAGYDGSDSSMHEKRIGAETSSGRSV